MFLGSIISIALLWCREEEAAQTFLVVASSKYDYVPTYTPLGAVVFEVVPFRAQDLIVYRNISAVSPCSPALPPVVPEQKRFTVRDPRG